MNYSEAVDYLNGFVNLERGPLDSTARAVITLDSVRELARRLGDPQKRFASLHVAGTKGKGSTCAFAASILRAHGLRMGLYVSPHLEDVRERITIDGAMIPQDAFARILSACVPVLEAMRHPPKGGRRPTYFEIVTHLAFAWFAEEKVDAAVIEVGLGGRLDATNIIVPEVCGIANISYDHTAILGSTLDRIAREKAGIFKASIPAVSAPQNAEAERALSDCALKVGAPLERIGHDILFEEIAADSADSVDEWPLPNAWARMPDGTGYRATLGLRGLHQIENWALAVRMADVFHRRQRGTPLSQDAVARGSREVVWPGRLERIVWSEASRAIPIYLDGAHNARSIDVVLSELRAHVKRAPLVCLFGCARDKDIVGMLRSLARKDSGADIVTFTDSGNPRGFAPADLARNWKNYSETPAEVRASSEEGLALAINAAGANGAVLVAGSLYLVGKVKTLLTKKSAHDERRLTP